MKKESYKVEKKGKNRKMAKLKALPLALFCGILITILSCDRISQTSQPENAILAQDNQFKILIIYNDDKEIGYSWGGQHFTGIQYLEKQFGNDIEVFHEELVPQDEEVIRQLVADHVSQGVRMVISASGSYASIIYDIAADYPDILFESCGGTETRHNVSVYFGRYYQTVYLGGLIAGQMTQTGRVGYIGPFKFPQTVRIANAFARGVREGNPRAEVILIWGKTWGDNEINRLATERLINDYNVDIVTGQQSTLAIGEVATNRGLLFIGNYSDMRQFHGNTALVSSIWNWGPYYAKRVKEAIIGAWQSQDTWGSLLKYNSMVKISDFSPVVPQTARNRVNEAYKEIISGQRDVFWGPLRDNAGNALAVAGDRLSDEEMLSMTFLVEGIREIAE